MKSMEDDIDIYGDLPDFGPEFSKNFVSNNEENIAEKQSELKKQIAELTAKLENSQMVNKSLEINLFSLLKTAKAEIARKDKTIDELRKRLDDATFRKSSYSNEHVTRKSSFCRTVANTNTHQKSIDICFSADEKSGETSSVATSLSNQSKDQQNKSTLVPITVFGERLLKRMTDEQNLEKKDKSNKLITNSDKNDDKNNTGYTVESDKENGSSRDTTNFDTNINTKEMQASATAQHKGSENLLAGSESPERCPKDVRSNDKNETSSTFQRKPKTSATYTGKRRANEEGNGHVHVKRVKSSREKESSSFEATKKETDNNINIVFSESKEKSSAFPRYSDFGFSDFCPNEKGRDKKYSEYARTWSNMELKKHGCFNVRIHDANKADEKRDAKNKHTDTNDRLLKRREKSAQSSTSISDKKKDTSYRCVEVYEKDSFHRHGHSEHRGSRDKQRDYHRTDDHRPSRAKSTLYREEKYHRSQYHSKNSDHDGGSKLVEERNCNLRNNGAANKSKICKKDSYNDDRQTKRSTTIDRTSTDQRRFDEIRKAECRHTNEHERARKIRNIVKSIRRHEESRTEQEGEQQGECSRRNFDAENLDTEHARYGQVAKEIDGKRNSGSTTEEAANALGIGNSGINNRRKHGGKELKNRSISLEGDEMLSDRRNRNSSRDDMTCDVGPRAAEEDASLNAANDTSIKRIGTARNETERWEASGDNVPRTIPILDTNVACFPGEKNISKNIESVENIENFIRSSVFTRDNKALENVSGTSNANANANANAFIDNSQSGSIKEEKVEMQGNANAPNASSDDAVMSFVENLQITDNDDVSNVATSNENQRLKMEESSLKLETVSNNTEWQTEKNNARKATAGADDIGNIDCDRDENENASIAMEMVRRRTLGGEERVDKVRTGKREESSRNEMELKEHDLEKSINRSNNNESSGKDSMNVYGKIVVFARRKKPVCLADSNANMTVLINNNNNNNKQRDDTGGVDLSIGDEVV